MIYLVVGLLILCNVIGVDGSDAAAIRINVPLKAYIWSSDEQYNPYRELSEREKMLSEWVTCRGGRHFTLHMVYYDDKLVSSPSTTSPSLRLQQQNQGKEYYWKFLNATGVLPGLTISNTTTAVSFSFYTLIDDYIAFHCEYSRPFITDLMLPAYDIVVEFPSNSGSWKTSKTMVDSSSFGLLRWRFSTAPLTTWEDIIQNSTSLVPYPLDSKLAALQNLTYVVSPEHIQAMENPCHRDLVTFYIIVQNILTGRRRIYLTIPLLMEENGPDWKDVTDAFCTINETIKDKPARDCGFVHQLIMTNDHLLALSTRGLYVSETLSSIPFQRTDEDNKPFLSFGLVNPCSDMKDHFFCFDSADESGIPFPTPLIHEDAITVHYNPVCHIRQQPNFRDIVIVVVMEDKKEGTAPKEPFSKAVTILYSEAPYSTWTLLVKTVSFFDNATNEIQSLKSIFFNHERSHFDGVLELWQRGTETTRFVRFVLPIKTKPGDYYTKLGNAQGDGFLGTYFPESFTFHKTAISVGSMDVMFMGDQLWISEAGGPMVYQAVSRLNTPGIIEQCRFNHPDRNFVCVTRDHTSILVGKIAHAYAAQEIKAIEVKQIDSVAKDELWKIEPSSTMSKDEQAWVNKYSGAHLVKGLRGAYFTVSYQGNLVMWYLKGAAGGEKELLENLKHAGGPPSDTVYQFYETQYDKSDAENRAKRTEGARYAVKSIDIPGIPNLAGKPTDAPLVPFLIDAMTAVIYEASFPDVGAKREPAYLGQAHVGMTINCQNTAKDLTGSPVECDLYIRHLKPLSGGWLPGFHNSMLVYVSSSIPMMALKCDTEVHVAPMSNIAFIYIRRGRIDDYMREKTESNDKICEDWNLPGLPGWSQLIGWTFYIPGHFSVLINKIHESDKDPADSTGTLDISPLQWRNDPDPTIPPTTLYYVLGGFATTVANERLAVNLGQFEGFFINMNTKNYLDAMHPHRHPDDTYARDPWKLTNAECLFDLRLVNNTVLKSSGGSLALNLHDSLSFTVKLFARTNKAKIMLQEVLLKSTNSNPKLLRVRRSFVNGKDHQRYEFMVTPTGMGKGISTLTIRLTTCSMACASPCSLTYTFHMMRAIGRTLKTIYPVTFIL